MNMYPVKILVLEEEEEDIQYIQQFFIENKVKNEFYVLRDGAEALLYLRRATQVKETIPHLIFVSHTLMLNNRRILDRVSAHPKLKDIPSIILFKYEQEYAEFKQSNAFNKPALMKSFTMHSLVEALHHVSNIGLTIARDAQSVSV